MTAGLEKLLQLPVYEDVITSGVLSRDQRCLGLTHSDVSRFEPRTIQEEGSLRESCLMN
jgi:hypothetical protein